MSGPRISLGLGAKNLKDHDWIGVSDPYVVVSRPNENGGFTNIRTSETKMVKNLTLLMIKFFFIILNSIFRIP